MHKNEKCTFKNVIKSRKSSPRTSNSAATSLSSKRCKKNKYVYLSQSDIEISIQNNSHSKSCCFSKSNMPNYNRPQSAKDQSNLINVGNSVKNSNKSKFEFF